MTETYPDAHCLNDTVLTILAMRIAKQAEQASRARGDRHISVAYAQLNGVLYTVADLLAVSFQGLNEALHGLIMGHGALTVDVDAVLSALQGVQADQLVETEEDEG